MKTMMLFKYVVIFLCGVYVNGFAQSTREAILDNIAQTGEYIMPILCKR